MSALGECVKCGRQLTTEEAIRSDACLLCDPPAVRPDDTAGAIEKVRAALNEAERVLNDVWAQWAVPGRNGHMWAGGLSVLEDVNGLDIEEATEAFEAVVAAVREAEARADGLESDLAHQYERRAYWHAEADALAAQLAEAEARADEWRTNTETAQAALDRAVRDLRDETARAERAERALAHCVEALDVMTVGAASVSVRQLARNTLRLAAVSGEASKP